VIFVCPLGVGAHLEKWGVSSKKIRELDWWEKTKIKSITIVLTPSRHFSGRSLIDRNTTSWGSYSIIGPTKRVFLSGDGGYGKHFKLIGKKYGPFDLTIIDIGAFGDSWIDIHLMPEHAVQAHIDLKGKIMVPGHWGTFKLALHSWDEPIKRAYKAAKKLKVKLATPKLGQFVYPNSKLPVKQWWLKVK
jgi:L-ascorbate metabolism protein UlaG (beta-lactamase superfamily)